MKLSKSLNFLLSNALIIMIIEVISELFRIKFSFDTDGGYKFKIMVQKIDEDMIF